MSRLFESSLAGKISNILVEGQKMSIRKQNLDEASWKYNIKSGVDLRKAIDESDPKKVLEMIMKCCSEVVENINDEDLSFEFNRLKEEINDEMAWADIDEDSADYWLNEFYDLCDNTKVFIALSECDSPKKSKLKESKEFVDNLDRIADFMIGYDPYGFRDAYDGDEDEKRDALIRDIVQDRDVVQAYLYDIVTEQTGDEEMRAEARSILKDVFNQDIKDEEVVECDKKLKESELPNISKFIYDLDVDKGNAWSVGAYTKNGNGDKIITVHRNGMSDNSAKDIVKAVEKEYPQLKGEPTVNGRSIWFYLKEMEEPTSEDLEKDDEKIKNSKNKEIEDRIAELRLAIQDGVSEEERKAMEKEIADLEASLEECDKPLKEDSSAQNITWILDSYNWEVEVVTEKEIETNYYSIVRSVQEAKEFNYHSDYWGSAEQYQEDNVELVRSLESYIGSEILINFDDGDLEAKLEGVAIDKQYNSLSHTKILITDEKYLGESCRVKQKKLKEEINLPSNPEDGWGSDVEDALTDLFDRVDMLQYEIRNARRNSYARFGDTISDLVNELNEISYIASDTASYLNDQEVIEECDKPKNKLGESVSVATSDGSTVDTQDAASVQSNDGTVTVYTGDTTVVINNTTSEPIDDVSTYVLNGEVGDAGEPGDPGVPVDSEPEDSETEEVNESTSFEGTKADIMKKHPELKSNHNYDVYADDDWMAVDYNDDGSIKGLRLATKKDLSEDAVATDEEISSIDADRLDVLKNQGDVYMLQIKDANGEKYWVCENFNAATNEADNASEYDTKEEADKDYFSRVEVEVPTE